MIKVELDAVMRSKLDGLDKQIELCDEAGHTVGHFLPLSIYEDLFYAALAAETPYTAQELRQDHQATGGRSLKEIWQRLGRTT